MLRDFRDRTAQDAMRTAQERWFEPLKRGGSNRSREVVRTAQTQYVPLKTRFAPLKTRFAPLKTRFAPLKTQRSIASTRADRHCRSFQRESAARNVRR
jgi:hypothetical protein